MGWGSILGTIGGAIAAPFTGGASLAIGSAIGQSIDSANAAKKGAKQQQQGIQKGINAYAPYNRVGTAASQTLAGLLGIDPSLFMGAGGMAPGQPVQGPLHAWVDKMRSRTEASKNLNIWKPYGVTFKPETLDAPVPTEWSRPQTPSAIRTSGRTSSYSR